MRSLSWTLNLRRLVSLYKGKIKTRICAEGRLPGDTEIKWPDTCKKERPSEEIDPAHTFLLDFQPPEF